MNLESPWYLIIPFVSLILALLIKKVKIKDPELSKIADPHLLPHIINIPHKQNMAKYLAMLAIIALMSLALANPRWGEREYQLYSGNAASVIIIDVSTHMGCQDVKPSRGIRARQIASQIVNNFKQVNFGLLAFAQNPHLIVPITQDQATLNNYLPAIDYRLIYKQGQDLDASLELATEMLDNEATTKKSIILLSSGNFTTNFKAKYPVYVIGVGTEQGAPFHDRDDQHVYVNGQLQITKLNAANLKKLASNTHGKYFSYVEIQKNVQALDKYLVSQSLQHGTTNTVKTWNDGYAYILILVAILIAVSFYKGLIVLSLAIAVFLPINESYALEWSKLFKNNNQLAHQSVQSLDFATAATLFSDPYNKGVSLYKAQQYESAIVEFKKNNRPELKIDALYNSGNAYYMLENYKEAVSSYEEVLQLEPNHEDAKFNLELARKKLKEQDSCGCKDKKPSKEDGAKQDSEKDSKKDSEQKDKGSEKKSEQNQDKSSDQDSEKNADNNQNSDENKEAKQDAEQDLEEQQDSKSQQASTQDSLEQENAQEQQLQNFEQQNEEAQNAEQAEIDEQQQKWLQRINADISNFLKTRMYIDDLKSNK